MWGEEKNSDVSSLDKGDNPAILASFLMIMKDVSVG